MDLTWRAVRVDLGETFRVLRGKRSEGLRYGAMVCRRPTLDCIGGVAACGEAPCQRSLATFEQDHPIRTQPVASERVKRGDGSIAEASRPALVGAAGIHKTVADHPFAAGQRRADQLRDMIRARGGEKQRLSLGRPAFARRSKQQAADRLGARGSAGFARDNHVDAPGAQRLGEQPRLRGLARTLAALESNETSP